MRTIIQYITVAVASIGATALIIHADLAFWRANDIVVSAEQQRAMVEKFASTWQRPPNDEEMRGLLDRTVRQVIAERESLAQGLYIDDVVISRRLQELLELSATQSAMEETPTEHQLEAFLLANRKDFEVDRTVSFQQVFFDSLGNAIGADATARFMLGRLRSQEMPEDISKLGDPVSIPANFPHTAESNIAATFGTEFTVELAAVPIGEWHGPIKSQHGIHIVYVRNRTAGRLPELSDIIDGVRESWSEYMSEIAIENMHAELLQEYDVTVEDFSAVVDR